MESLERVVYDEHFIEKKIPFNKQMEILNGILATLPSEPPKLSSWQKFKAHLRKPL